MDQPPFPARPLDGRTTAAFLAGGLFLFSALFVRLGLHDEVNVCFAPLWLLFGIVATWISLGVWRPRLWPGWRVASGRVGPIVTIAGWVLGLAIILGPPHDPHALDARRQVQCRSHLEVIGTMLEMYQTDHAGYYPDRLDELLAAGLSPDCLVCPSTDARPAEGAKPADVAASLANGGHLSYVYVGRGLTTATTRPDTALMYEPVSNHHRDNPGLHVLYADGRVEYLKGEAVWPFLQTMDEEQHPKEPTQVSAPTPATAP